MNKITIGIIALVSILIIIIIIGAIRNRKTSADNADNANDPNEWPDPYYMDRVGKYCPTGWVYDGRKKNGKDICRNIYNIPTNGDSHCYTPNDALNVTDKVKEFSSFKKSWQDCINDPLSCKALKQRCKWISRCGTNGHTAQWIGFNKHCSIDNDHKIF